MSVAATAYIMHCICFNFISLVPLCYGLPEDGVHLPQNVAELICKDKLQYILHILKCIANYTIQKQMTM